MASYMTTMFQIARSIFQSKPVEPTEAKEAKDILKPEEAMKNTTEVSLPKDVKEVNEVNEVNDLSAPVEIILVSETVKDMSVSDTNELNDASELNDANDVKDTNIVPENMETETEKPKVVDSAPKRKPHGKTIKK